MNEEVNHRMRAAEEQVQYFRHHFLHAQEMSNSTFHRKVTWHVGGIRERLRRLVETKGVLSFHSPELHFGGQRLVLELQLPAVEDLQAALDLVGPPPAVPLPGVCAVRIWAKPGCRLSCQLQLGASPPRKAEHTFQAGTTGPNHFFSSFARPSEARQVMPWMRSDVFLTKWHM
eukprot:symbB.v1.2.008388.t1/scaffold525.1/size192214/13